eukprot:12796054-Alexandrium_andersonii.AAC.1
MLVRPVTSTALLSCSAQTAWARPTRHGTERRLEPKCPHALSHAALRWRPPSTTLNSVIVTQ